MKIEHMKAKFIICALALISIILPLAAQNKKTDSIKVVAAFKELLYACKNVNFDNPELQNSGMFFNAAPYIIYRGDNQQRKWKDFCDYKVYEERRQVNEVCFKLVTGINRDSSYSIDKYFTEKESEGTWHVLMVTYKKKGVDKKSAFAFLRVKERFGLGDID